MSTSPADHNDSFERIQTTRAFEEVSAQIRRRVIHGQLRPGDRLRLIPGHCDPTVNLHEHYIVVRGGLEAGRVEAVWPIDARGCIR